MSTRHDVRLSAASRAAAGWGVTVAIDTSVTEWTVDLHPVTADVRTTVQASLGYVDFDVVDSVHESPAASVVGRPR